MGLAGHAVDVIFSCNPAGAWTARNPQVTIKSRQATFAQGDFTACGSVAV